MKIAMHRKRPSCNFKKIFKLIYEKRWKIYSRRYFKVKQISEIKTSIISEKNTYNFEKAVITSGAYSKKLTDQLGENIPLDTESGYHVHFKNMQKLISRPIICLDRGFSLTPMNQGLRAVGTVELGGLKNPPSQKKG